jgi:hypothetical protein
MSPQIIINPGKVISWSEFCEKYPPNSIALDGYVYGKPQFHPNGYANFNHHEEVFRPATRSTAAQVLITIRTGLFQAFDWNNLKIFVNDCDEDVCSAIFLLNNPRLVMSASNPAINRFIQLVDFLDTTAGAYPFSGELDYSAQLRWVFLPYRLFRKTGINNKNPDEFRSIITDVGNRIMKLVIGSSESIHTLDNKFQVMNTGKKGWKMVREIGTDSRIAMFNSGILAFVSVLGERDGIYRYVIGRPSPFISWFPLRSIFTVLNETEGISNESFDRWDGGDDIGGSPRNSGSSLNPDRLFQIINDIVIE